MVRSLQALRGMLALMIFFHHCYIEKSAMSMLGNLAVSAFFMLSGYVTAMTRYDSVIDGTFRWLSFMRSKYLRLLPVYIVCLLLALWIYDEFDRASDLWHHFILLQSWIVHRYHYYFAGTGVGWFISSLLLGYAVFPLMAKTLDRAERRVWVPVAVVLILYIMYLIRYNNWRDCAYIYIFPPARAVDFFWGVVLWRLTTFGRGVTVISRLRTWSQWRVNLVGWSVMALSVATCIFGEMTPEYLRRASLCWPAAWLLLAIVVIFDGRGGVIDRIMSCRALQSFSTVSFAFYLIHLEVIHWFEFHFDGENLPLPQMVCFTAATFVVSLAMSVVLNRLVERPAAAWLRRRRPEAAG